LKQKNECKIKTSIIISTLSYDRTVHYELFAVICHIEDPRTGGNLVAHIKAGEAYHLTKEVGHKFPCFNGTASVIFYYSCFKKMVKIAG